MDEVGQIDLLIGVVGGRRRIAQRHRQIGDLGDDLVGQVHEEPQRGTDDIVQGDQDGERQEGPQAAGHGVDALFGVQVGHLLLLPLLVVGVAGLDILDLALHPVHAQHALLALHLEGQDHQLHHQGEEDQGHAVGTGQAVEDSRQPCERHTDIISDLCKHVFFLRRLLLVLRVVTNARENRVRHPQWSRNGIVPAALVERMAPEKPPQGKPAALQGAVLLHRLQRVLGAGGNKAAARRAQR